MKHLPVEIVEDVRIVRLKDDSAETVWIVEQCWQYESDIVWGVCRNLERALQLVDEAKSEGNSADFWSVCQWDLEGDLENDLDLLNEYKSPPAKLFGTYTLSNSPE
jgi:hypothetical protein